MISNDRLGLRNTIESVWKFRIVSYGIFFTIIASLLACSLALPSPTTDRGPTGESRGYKKNVWEKKMRISCELPISIKYFHYYGHYDFYLYLSRKFEKIWRSSEETGGEC